MKKIIYTLVFSLVLFNCSTDSVESLQAAIAERNTPETPEEAEPITYNNQISAIMANNCTVCHGQPLTNGAPFPLLTFEQVRDQAASIEFRMNSIGAPMPPSGILSPDIRAQVEQWRTDGTLEE